MQEGIGESIGGLLQALGIGLGAHGQQKMQQQQQQRTRQAFGKAIPGHEYLADLPEVAQKEAFSKLFEGPLEKLFSQRAMEERGQGQENFQQPNPGLQELFGSMGQSPNSAQEGIMNGLRGINIGTPQEQVPNMEPTRGGEKAQERQKKFKNASGFTESEKARIALRNPQLAAQLQRSDLAEEERDFRREESRRKEGREDSKEYNDYVAKAGRKAKKELPAIKRSQRLIEEGENPDPLFWSGLRFFGLDFPSFLSADAQEREKLVVDFLGDIKDTFGSRPPLGEIQIFMKKLPDLVNTPEGSLRALRNMEIMADIALLTDNTRKKVIKANAGERPGDLEDRVEDLIGPAIQKKWDNFINGPIRNETAGKGPKNATEAPQQRLPPPPKGKVYVIRNGKKFTIPKENLEEFLADQEEGGTLFEQ